VDKAFVIQGVANKLWATESAMDTAIGEASKLMGGIMDARRELNCSYFVTDASTTKVAEAIAAMSQARHALIEAHSALAEAKLRLGVRTKLVGTAPSKDKDYFFSNTAEDVVMEEDRRTA
jgi:hypothetical protein